MMFYDTKIDIHKNFESSLCNKTIYADVQPYSDTLGFNYGLSLQISNKVFCDIDKSINEEAYFKIENTFYKVLSIKEWSDHMEILLYRCKRMVV